MNQINKILLYVSEHPVLIVCIINYLMMIIVIQSISKLFKTKNKNKDKDL